MTTKLRAYQRADLDCIIAAFNEGVRRILYTLPTGGGKTVIFTDLAREVDAAGLGVIILTHRDELMQQASQALQRLGVLHGVIAAGGAAPTRHRVQVASVFTLVRRLDWLAGHSPRLVIVDEAHHAAASTWKRIMAALPEEADILGVTATPRRLDGKPLDDHFDRLICGPSIAKLIDDEWLAPCTVFTPPRGPDLSKVKIRAGDYAVDQLAEVMGRRVVISGAVKEYERLCPGKPAIAFCVDIDHSERVARAFAARGWRAAHVDGETPTRHRRELIAALDRGELDILCNCGLISEGLDVPGVEAAILLRPTKSLALYLQMVGRALRPGKEMAHILDHAGNVYRHGLPTARRRWSLRGKVRQHHDDDAAADLIRCPECGAINPASADLCENCGAPLHTRRLPVQEDAGRRLAEAIEDPTTDEDLAAMTYKDALRWCADRSGELRRDRLQRTALAREYKVGWVYYNAGKNWEDVWEAWKGRPK